MKGGRCTACRAYRGQLRAMYRRWSTRRSQVAKYTNNRYLKTPEKERKMKTLRARVVAAKKHARKLKEEIERSTERNGIPVQENLNELLIRTMEEENRIIEEHFPAGSLFWEQQLKAARAKDARQMRWHPCMVHWCLNLKLLSSAAYHSLRTSGFLTLPSERTLRDYSHFIK